MPNPGDVVGFVSDEAGKHKFHLCVCPTGKYLFINSPKPRSYPGDFHVPSAEVPLPPTPEGYSIVSCTVLMSIPDAELAKRKAATKGKVSSSVLKDLIAFVEGLTVLSQDEKDAIIDGLADWLWPFSPRCLGWFQCRIGYRPCRNCCTQCFLHGQRRERQLP
jgi:hypothetical protein